MRLWGGRFEHGPSEVFERFSGSLHFDRQLADVDIRGSQAWARALERAGILTHEECSQLVAAFNHMRDEVGKPAFFAGAKDEDIHTLIIRKLKEHAGALADKMHTGRSRNEQVSLDERLWLREEIDVVQVRLIELMHALVAMAHKYPAAVVPGYTHTRRAQAVEWAHYLMAYFEMFARDWERSAEARARVNVMPLGSGALAGSGFPFDREAIALELGFVDFAGAPAITRNSMDVAGDRDFALDFLHAASLAMLHLSRLAEDWILFSSDEFGWLELGDGVTSGSSLMPQKKNPDSLELIRGKSGRVFGAYGALYVTMKGLLMTYNRDLQEDKEPLFEAAYQLNGSLEMARLVVETTRLHPEKPAAAAEESWVVATDLAEALARAGTPFHMAHQVVGKLVLESARAGKRPSDWSGAALAAFAPQFTADMVRLLKPEEGMKTRELEGGTGPKAVALAVEEARARMEAMRSRTHRPHVSSS